MFGERAKRKPSALPRRELKKMRARTTGTKNVKQKGWASVTCPIHGSMDKSSKVGFHQLRVSLPLTRRQQLSGCPICQKGKHGNADAREHQPSA
jgi:hypothetical protein